MKQSPANRELFSSITPKALLAKGLLRPLIKIKLFRFCKVLLKRTVHCLAKTYNSTFPVKVLRAIEKKSLHKVTFIMPRVLRKYNPFLE
jgi:hypothetical protein